MKILSKRATIAAVAVALTAGTALIGATPAHAVSGYDLDGTDPSVGHTGCASGATLIHQSPIKVGGTGASVGTFQVWYSPSCGTNWVQALNNSGYGPTIKTVRREPNSPNHVGDGTDPGPGWSYSMQVYAPGATCIHADTVILGPDGDFYAWAGVNLC